MRRVWFNVVVSLVVTWFYYLVPVPWNMACLCASWAISGGMLARWLVRYDRQVGGW